MDIHHLLLFQPLKCAIWRINGNIDTRIFQCCSPPDPTDGAIVATPGKTPLHNSIRKRRVVVDDFTHDNSEFAKTRLCSYNCKRLLACEEIEIVSPFAVRQNRSVDKYYAGELVDVDLRIDVVHEPRSGNLIIYVQVDSVQETNEFVIDTRGDCLIPVGNQYSVVCAIHRTDDCIGDGFDFGDSGSLDHPGG